MSVLFSKRLVFSPGMKIAEQGSQLAQIASVGYKYFGVGFNNIKMNLSLFASFNGTKFDCMGDAFIPALGNANLRDPSVVKIGDWYYICYTNGYDTTGSTIGMCKTQDFIAFTELAPITIGSFTKIWAPSWFVESGIVYIILNATSSSDFVTYRVTYDSTTHTISGLAQITGTELPATMIDAHIYKIGSVYYMFYKNETTKYIELASSNAPFSGYNVIGSGDWAGFGSGFEGPCLVMRSDGDYALYFDDYTNNIFYMATSTAIASGWSAKSAISFSVLDNFSHLEIINFPLSDISQQIFNNKEPVVSFSKTTTLTTTYQDVFTGNDKIIPNGVYDFVLQSVTDNGGLYNESYAGTIYWMQDATNSSEATAIPVVSMGHAPNGNPIVFQVLRKTGSTGAHAFQFKHNTSSATNPATYNFKFKRVL